VSGRSPGGVTRMPCSGCRLCGNVAAITSGLRGTTVSIALANVSVAGQSGQRPFGGQIARQQSLADCARVLQRGGVTQTYPFAVFAAACRQPAFRKLSRTAREPFRHSLRMTAERHFHSRRSDGRQKRRLAAGDPAGRGREGRARDRGIGRRAQLRVRRRPPPVQSSSSAASMTGRSCAASVNISVNWSSAVRVSRPVRVIR
jgi:hypothetical protein